MISVGEGRGWGLGPLLTAYDGIVDMYVKVYMKVWLQDLVPPYVFLVALLADFQYSLPHHCACYLLCMQSGSQWPV